MIEVVSAVIVREGRILLAQRPPTKDYAWCWETPGGKVELGESHHTAIRREILEELDMQVDTIHETSLWSGEIKREGREPVFLAFYLVGHVDGNPIPKELQGFGWFTGPEMTMLKLAPGNVKASGVLCDLLRRLA